MNERTGYWVLGLAGLAVVASTSAGCTTPSTTDGGVDVQGADGGDPDAATIVDSEIPADAPAATDAAEDVVDDATQPTDAGTGSPSITLVSPTGAARVVLTGNAFDISFTVTNFTLMAPGSCAGAPGCGHVHVVLKNGSGSVLCDMGDGYSAAASASPYTMRFTGDYGCTVGNTETYNLDVELNRDNHTTVVVGGYAVHDQANIQFQ